MLMYIFRYKQHNYTPIIYHMSDVGDNTKSAAPEELAVRIVSALSGGRVADLSAPP